MTLKTYIKQNNTSPTLDAILKDSKGNVVDVSAASVQFKMQKQGESGLKIDAPATVVDGVAGHVRYTLQSGDTDTPGTYNAEYEVTFIDGTVESFINSPKGLEVIITRAPG